MFVDRYRLGFRGMSRRRFFKTATIAAGSLCIHSNDSRHEAGEKKNPSEAAISPSGEVIPLFNGKDLTGLYGWLKDTKYEDPRKVFTVQDGLLRI